MGTGAGIIRITIGASGVGAYPDSVGGRRA